MKLFWTSAIIATSFVYQYNAYAQADMAIVQQMIKEIEDNSQLEQLGMELLDDIGPRLIGSPQLNQAHQWLNKTYNKWGINSWTEEYGMWKGWERGYTHAEMTYPRKEQLTAFQLAYCPSTNGKTIEGKVISIPTFNDSLDFKKWLFTVKGKIVMVSKPEISGRPESSWKEHATSNDYETYKNHNKQVSDDWNANLRRAGTNLVDLTRKVEQAGAVGVITSAWTGGWGSNKVFAARTTTIPNIDVRMEEYQMLYRFINRGISPIIKIKTESKHLGNVPAKNAIAKITGQKDEIVLLSAHLDSWDGGTGATDNGTGTLLMMEVMRVLKKYYPNPKRTIMVGHWNGEEQGLNGSRGFVAYHPELINKISVVFNQDNGTGRVNYISGNAFINAYDYFKKWMDYIPNEITKDIKTEFPGDPTQKGSSDHTSFLAAGIPAFFLIGQNWDYGLYTWHTRNDTYDKIVWSDVKKNAIALAIMTYLACEEEEMMDRTKAMMPLNIKTNNRKEWPKVVPPNRDGKY